MGKTSRTKGAAGEREFCKKLSAELESLGVDCEISRNLSQTRDGGFDIAGLEQFAIEIKRAKTPAVREWWVQTVLQSYSGGNGQDRVPVLAYRIDRKQWRVVMHINDITHPDFALSANDSLQFTVEMDLYLFAQLVNDRFTKEQWIKGRAA